MISYRLRRLIIVLVTLAGFVVVIASQPAMYQPASPDAATENTHAPTGDAAVVLEQLPVKGRAPKTDYARTQFGDGWASTSGCDTRNIILNRDMTQVTHNDQCQVLSGILSDPYKGTTITFTRGATSSQAVQIDHVVALSNAWQTGAQQLTPDTREQLANDPLELLAVDGKANQQKSDGDAATWLPLNKSFRCQYVARQISVKQKYSLWVTPTEKDAMARVLATCPGQKLLVTRQ